MRGSRLGPLNVRTSDLNIGGAIVPSPGRHDGRCNVGCYTGVPSENLTRGHAAAPDRSVTGRATALDHATRSSLITVRVRKAVLPAAGFGTRFLPASKAIPQPRQAIQDESAFMETTLPRHDPPHKAKRTGTAA